MPPDFFRKRLPVFFFTLAVSPALVEAQMDVIVSDTTSVVKNGTVGDITGYSLATTSCNIGDQVAIWIETTNEHPVIAQNLYRVRDGLLEHIGQSWLKHAFCAVNEFSCGACQTTPCTTLGLNCADTYGTSLNGLQSNLGPRYDVNASTGYFNYPFPTRGQSGDAIYKRLQVHNDDLDPALNRGARYFGVVQYLTTDEPAFDTHHNNNSYRELTVGAFTGGGYELSYVGTTQTQADPIQAWADSVAGVSREEIPVPEDSGSGELIVGSRVEAVGGGIYRYQYAVFNNTSHRSARRIVIPTDRGAGIANVLFHDVDYHSGEPYDGTDWDFERQADNVVWSTQTHADNADANAIRWGTTYSFSFDADTPPFTVTGNIGLFRPGAGDSVSFTTLAPGPPPPLVFLYRNGVPDLLSPAGDSFDVAITATGGTTLDPSSPTLTYDAGQGFVSTRLTPLGGSLYAVSFPPRDCGTTVTFHLSAQTTTAVTVTDPLDGAMNPYSASFALGQTEWVDDLETDLGWQVGAAGDDATSGVWELVDPLGTAAQPENDHTPTGTDCWVTGQGLPGGSIGDNDVDNGQTTLHSPMLDLSRAFDPQIDYWRWFSNDQGASPASDVFVVELTDGGGTWVNVETVGPSDSESSGGWFRHTFRVADLVELSSAAQLRFVASDEGSGSIVEAAVDDLRIVDLECGGEATPFVRGDCNDDGNYDISDPIQLLDTVFATGTILCDDACDGDDDDALGLPDAIYFLNHLFLAGPQPPAPFSACGRDPSGTDLSCEAFSDCP